MANAKVLVGLTTINDAETNSNWSNLGGGGSPSNEPDYYVQNIGSVSRTVSNQLRGFYYDDPAGITTVPVGQHVFVWLYLTGYPAADTTALGGLRIVLGNAGASAYKEYYVDGQENLTGGWRCYVVNPQNTADNTVGTPPTNEFTTWGTRANITRPVAKNNLACDVIRVGLGLTVYNGDVGAPAGISSVTDVNDASLNQFGVFAATDTGALIQGKLFIGLDDTTTDTYFSDSNAVIVNPDKNPEVLANKNTDADFTGMCIQGGLTTCILSNVSFFSVDTHDRGFLDCNTATNKPLKVDIDGCTFQDWGVSLLSSNTDVTNSTYINTRAITLNSGTLDNCTVETGIGGTYVFAGGTPNNISNTSFIGGGTGGGHGFEVTQGGTYSFVGNGFTGFGDNTTDDAAVHINGGATGIAVTFNITGGGTGGPEQGFTYKLTPSVDTGGGISTVTFVSAVTVNINGLPVVPTGNATEIRILGAGTTNEIAGVGTENHRTSTYSFSLSSGTNFDVRILNLDYVPAFVSNQTASTDPTNIPVDLKLDRVYDDDTPPTGE
jgi:hypothetical protein